MDEWISNIRSIHTVKYYFAIERHEILIYAELQKHRAKCKKLDTKGHTLYDSTYMKHLK